MSPCVVVPKSDEETADPVITGFITSVSRRNMLMDL